MKRIGCIGVIFLLAMGLFSCKDSPPPLPTAGSTAAAAATDLPFSLPGLTEDSTNPDKSANTSEGSDKNNTGGEHLSGSTGSKGSTNRPGSSNTTSSSAAQPATQTVVSVSIPEGFTFYQIAQRLEARGVCTAQAFYTAAQSYQVQSFATPYSRESCYYLEGFLFPDTYEFYQNDDPNAVLRKFLNNYAAKSGLPSYDTLILASIIERETRSAAHMAMVSSVFHNRLRQGMRLQADATIAYVEQHIKPSALVSNSGQYAERYNTYKCAALPVGPICNPGLQAIQAAQNPSSSDYLYYFFGNDNDNHYSKSHEEHVAAKAKYGVNYGTAS